MDKSLILNKIKEHLNIRFDKDLADFLGIKTTTLAMWYSRNTYDVELLFKKCDFLNAEWLLTGKGSMLKKGNNSIITYLHDNEEAVEQSNYKDLADARLQIIEMKDEKILRLEKELSELKYTQKEPFLYKNVAESAPELIKKEK